MTYRRIDMRFIQKFNFKNLLLYSVIFAILTLSIVPVFAIASYSITIDLGKIESSGFDIRGRRLKLWRVSDKKMDSDEASDNIFNFDKLSLEELDNLFSDNFVTDPSDDKGQIFLKNLKEGTYYVREVLRDGDKKHVSPFFIMLPLDDNKNVVYPKLIYDTPNTPPPNTPPDTTILKKLSTDGKALPKAVFELYRKTLGGDVRVPLDKNSYDENGKSDVLLVTNEKGEIVIKNLPEGEYYFKEIKAPDGYEIVNKVTNFNVTGNRGSYVEVVNRPFGGRGEIRFFKYDAATDKALAGAVFKVTYLDEKTGSYETVKRDGKDYIIMSGKDGAFSATDLPAREYYLWEIKAPEGYELLAEGVKFTINENSKFNRVDIANKKEPTDVPNVPPNTPNTPPPRIRIPKTGDITLIVMSIGGAIIAAMGVGLVKKGKK
jgi:LPXTG-motif cell wall-anchored protein